MITFATLACAALRLNAEDYFAGLNGFGSMPALFEDPLNNPSGFRDYTNFLNDALTTTEGGIYAANFGASDGTVIDQDRIDYFRVVDDLDEDGIAGADIVIVIGPDGLPRITTVRDFDDLHRFNIFFDSVGIRTQSVLRTADVMRVQWLTGSTRTAGLESGPFSGIPATHSFLLRSEHAGNGKAFVFVPQTSQLRHQVGYFPYLRTLDYEQNRHALGLVYGMRVIDTNEESDTALRGGLLAPASWDMRVDNQIIGPQVGIVWGTARGPLLLEIQSLLLAGYNTSQVQLNGSIGVYSVPGALNQGLYARRTHFEHGETHQKFSPAGEIRAQTSLQVWPSMSIKAAWAAFIVDNWLDDEGRLHYSLPDMGLLNPGSEHLIVQTAYCGIHVVF